MKLFFVSNSSHSLWNFRGDLFRKLMQAGHEVCAVCPEGAETPKLRAIGVAVFIVPMAPKKATLLQNSLLVRDLWRLYRRENPDIIFHYTIKPNIFGTVAAKLAAIPSISVITGLGYAFLSDSIVARIARTMYRFALHIPKQVWFLNQDDRELFINKRICPPDVARILPGEGIDLDYFRPQASATPDMTVLMIARALWDKGTAEFVECAALIHRQRPDVRFAILGPSGADSPGGIPDSQMQRWASDGVIDWLSATDDVRPFIRDAVCVVLPSYREGIPRSLLEGSAMEKPLVATNVTGCKEIVVDGVTGFLCEARNPQSLADAVQRVLALNDEARAKMGKAGREFVRQTYSNEKIFTKYDQAIAEIGQSAPN